MFACFATYGKSSSHIGARSNPLLHRFTDAHVFALYLVTGCNARRVVFMPLRVYIGKEEIEDDLAFTSAEGQHQVCIHNSFVDIDHEVGIEPEVPGSISFASSGDRNMFRAANHGTRLQAIVLAILNGVVGIVEHAVQALVQMRDVISAIEVVVYIYLPVAIEDVGLPGMKVE